MTTLFVSDLHLDPARPAITDLFLGFLRGEAARAQALYILGDLFESWVGDDDPSEAGVAVAAALRGLAASGVPVYFMRGNRDFLVGPAWAARAGLRILPDPAVVSLQGEPVLLMHGDLLCTDDTAYQAFRAQTRDPEWQRRFLAQPLEARLAFANQARQASMARQRELKSDRAAFETITDVTPATVETCLARYGVSTLIHGHTHRPAEHLLTVDGRPCRRIVLGDWYEQGSVLRVDASGMRLERL
ncbi:UDP-2,3-diacylglucosamine diphosphatase [Pseudoxanthomonas taiwanensis]|uniref:UDP-2,3-diacylglucosamine hydrolase n=1 Tax=Pseudoxanthomonas taiwanensis TaxID=176598 RepID=A0A921NZ85_9GAMM|nr:UDP-2,3-diacylglucosamine diphosphatase [Pseudoxanthomonas taiwanensis]KAF1686785.1 UDP-2,3-diacylglucosamine diphosphatase [Pseudoxanthomonas taiwanensis]